MSTVQIHEAGPPVTGGPLAQPQHAPAPPPTATPGSAAATMARPREERCITDATGRPIWWKPLSYLDQLRLAEIVGPENGRNESFMLLATLALSVIRMADDPPPGRRARTRAELEMVLQRLDDAGVEALLDDLRAMTPEAGDESADAKLARAKN